jgi:hypothetical protein
LIQSIKADIAGNCFLGYFENMTMNGKSKKRCFPFTHPLKQQIKELGVSGHRLTALTGIGEPELSRCLEGIDPMPYHLEKRLRAVIDFLKEPDNEIYTKEN